MWEGKAQCWWHHFLDYGCVAVSSVVEAFHPAGKTDGKHLKTAPGSLEMDQIH